MKNIGETQKRLEVEYENAVKALKVVREQIQVYNKKGEELVAHLNYVKGAIDVLKDVSSEEEAKEDPITVEGDKNV